MDAWREILDVVEPHESVSVTTASMQSPCLLAIHAPRSATKGWPDSIHSILGTVVHDLIDQLASLPEERQLLIDTPNALQSRLSECVHEHGIDTQRIGNTWQSCLRALRRALEEFPRGFRAVENQSSNCAARSPAFAHEQYVSASSTEGWTYDLELGVHGKFDFRLELEKEVRVDDFKTGCVNGNIAKLEKWRRQVAIYTLISVRANPDKHHTARIIAADGIFVVDTSNQELRRLEDELRSQKSLWPTALTNATELSTICSTCRMCRARHICPAYRSRTPWVEDSAIDTADGPIWSWDVWGTVARISTGGPRHSLVVETDASRVIVNGFDTSAGINDLSIGDRVGIFGVRKDKNYSLERPVFQAQTRGNNTTPTRVLRA